MNLQMLNDVQIDPKIRGSINYAKARAAIDQAATIRKEKRMARNAVIELLGGVSSGHEVVFPDGSKAKY